MESAAEPALPAPRQYIGGEWVNSASGALLDIEDPSSGQIVGAIAAGNAADVDAAVSAASDAMKRTRQSRWTPAERQDALLALARALEANAGEFAALETLDAGKPIFNSQRIDVPGSIAALKYYAGWATKLTGETMELSSPGNVSAYTRLEPVGVVGQIVPWNYPLMGAACKLGPAIAAGCAVVLKPAELTSLSTLKLAELAGQCGFPAGFLNVVTGTGEEVGAALVEHPGVAKISFTGSTPVGVGIAASCGRQMKRCTVELGGKSAVIVLPDADLDAAARAIAMSIFLNTGQSCSAASRLLVHASVACALIERIAAIAATMPIGQARNPDTRLGPVISARQRDRITGFIESALAGGGRLAHGGERIAGAGHFMEPTILTDVTPGIAAVEQEIFGPVLCAMEFETEDLDEIAALANDSSYGLAAYAWTARLSTAHALVDRLQAGTVRINACGGNDFAMPVGGVKLSGFGRENGRAGVMAYTEAKSVTMAY